MMDKLPQSAPQDELQVALLQINLKWEDPSANFHRIADFLQQLSPHTDLVLLPEMFSTGFTMNPDELGGFNALEGVQQMRKWSMEHAFAIGGSLCIEENGKFFNRLLVFYQGEELVQYDKRHLFSLAGEEKIYTPGNSLALLKLKGWKICPLICYDLRFPVWSRNADDVDLYLYVANWPERRIQAWEKLLQARAIENMAYVAGVNRVGEDGQGIAHNGASQIIDPLGEVILRQADHREGWISATLSWSTQQALRARFGFLKDRDRFTLQL
jgi:omega-amidase